MKNPVERMVIRGFRSIKEADLPLGPVNVLIGPNGAGKSNFISFFQMLAALIEGRLGDYVGRAGGANAILHYGRKHTEAVRAELYFGDGTYVFGLAPTAADAFIFMEERLQREKEPGLYAGSDYGSGHREASVAGESFDWAPGVSSHVQASIRSWRVYHFHDTSKSAPVKQTGDVHVNDYLRADAGNLAAFLYLLRQKHPDSLEHLRSMVRLVFPQFGDFVLAPEPLNESKIRLKWRETGSDYPFLADQLSDGTLRFIALATALLQPSRFRPTTLLIDEPELGLHPAALTTLAALIREASRQTQLILSTQSVSLVDAFEPEEIITVDRAHGEEGATIFRRHSTAELAYWLEEYSLSEVWEKNVIGGRP